MSKRILPIAENAHECKTEDCSACTLAATNRHVWTADKPLSLYADRKTCAAIVTHFLFSVMPRTIATWPLVARRPNRTVVYEVAEVMQYATKRFKEAYQYKQA